MSMNYRSSSKRQSNLEIRTHHRLLPRKVGNQAEQQHLLRKRSQLNSWLSQPEDGYDQAKVAKMLDEHNKAYSLSIKFYSEKRRKRFDKLTASLRKNEHSYIKSVVKHKQRQVIVTSQISMVERLIMAVKNLFCCA